MSNEITVTSKTLPTNLTLASFGVIDPAEKPIQGELLKCTDGIWSSKSNGRVFPHGTRMVAVRTVRAAQRFESGKPETIVETADEPLPDVAAWNAAIPKDQWEIDLNGNPRPPWAPAVFVYLVDPRDAAIYTYGSSTAGAEIAFNQLTSRMARMCALSGKLVVPIVEFGDRIVSKRFNKKGPAFHIVDWLELVDRPDPATRRIAQIYARSDDDDFNDDIGI
jgi:hypothetical protein